MQQLAGLKREVTMSTKVWFKSIWGLVRRKKEAYVASSPNCRIIDYQCILLLSYTTEGQRRLAKGQLTVYSAMTVIFRHLAPGGKKKKLKMIALLEW